MGRYVTASEIGIEPGENFVHKFWVAVQPSADIEAYLETYTVVKSPLDVSAQLRIKNVVDKLKQQFAEKHGTSFDEYMAKVNDKGYTMSTQDEETLTKKWRDMEADAAKIELGVNLLKTIEQMEAAGLDYQTLEIET